MKNWNKVFLRNKGIWERKINGERKEKKIEFIGGKKLSVLEKDKIEVRLVVVDFKRKIVGFEIKIKEERRVDIVDGNIIRVMIIKKGIG